MKRILAVGFAVAAIVILYAATSVLVPKKYDFTDFFRSPIAYAQQYAACNPGQTPATNEPCGSAAYGMGTIASSAQTVNIYTIQTSYTAPIQLTYDYSLATGLAAGATVTITCNTTGQPLEVSARSPGAYFTVKAQTGVFSTNPGCFTWFMSPQ
jgi:hypothetical protein